MDFCVVVEAEGRSGGAVLEVVGRTETILGLDDERPLISVATKQGGEGGIVA